MLHIRAKFGFCTNSAEIADKRFSTNLMIITTSKSRFLFTRRKFFFFLDEVRRQHASKMKNELLYNEEKCCFRKKYIVVSERERSGRLRLCAKLCYLMKRDIPLKPRIWWFTPFVHKEIKNLLRNLILK